MFKNYIYLVAFISISTFANDIYQTQKKQIIDAKRLVTTGSKEINDFYQKTQAQLTGFQLSETGYKLDILNRVEDIYNNLTIINQRLSDLEKMIKDIQKKIS